MNYKKILVGAVVVVGLVSFSAVAQTPPDGTGSNSGTNTGTIGVTYTLKTAPEEVDWDVTFNNLTGESIIPELTPLAVGGLTGGASTIKVFGDGKYDIEFEWDDEGKLSLDGLKAAYLGGANPVQLDVAVTNTNGITTIEGAALTLSSTTAGADFSLADGDAIQVNAGTGASQHVYTVTITATGDIQPTDVAGAYVETLTVTLITEDDA